MPEISSKKCAKYRDTLTDIICQYSVIVNKVSILLSTSAEGPMFLAEKNFYSTTPSSCQEK